MNIEELRDLLERYRLGTCTAREREAVESWYASLHPGEEAPLSADAIEASLARVHMRLPWREENEFTPRRLRPMILAAAAALVVLVVGVWFLVTPHKAVGPIAGGGDVVVRTNRGETRQIVLPDGSTLQVNAGTELRYPVAFAGRERKVVLIRGEAFFQVVADATRPFVVMSGGLRTKVLGTSFDIRAYSEEKTVRVAVVSGKVEVAGTAVKVLEKGMLVRADTTGLVTDRFDGEEEVAAWKSGGLYFKDASFEQIAFEVGNKYNVQLVNESHKRIWSYTGLFRSESLQ
jgi:ferric-dicitrate binding protein FerR (iron transport regulator)